MFGCAIQDGSPFHVATRRHLNLYPSIYHQFQIDPPSTAKMFKCDWAKWSIGAPYPYQSVNSMKSKYTLHMTIYHPCFHTMRNQCPWPSIPGESTNYFPHFHGVCHRLGYRNTNPESLLQRGQCLKTRWQGSPSLDTHWWSPLLGLFPPHKRKPYRSHDCTWVGSPAPAQSSRWCTTAQGTGPPYLPQPSTQSSLVIYF